jgi:hypothetical protein
LIKLILGCKDNAFSWDTEIFFVFFAKTYGK